MNQNTFQILLIILEQTNYEKTKEIREIYRHLGHF